MLLHFYCNEDLSLDTSWQGIICSFICHNALVFGDMLVINDLDNYLYSKRKCFFQILPPPTSGII